MAVCSLKKMAVVFLSASVLFVVAGCKEKVESAKQFVAEKIKSEPVKKLDPEVMSVVDTEFAGMEIKVTADDAKQTSQDESQDVSGISGAVVMDYPVFRARTDNGSVTELTGPRAYVDPENKLVRFDLGATVTGPWDNVLEADSLVWYYTREMIEVDGRFTLTNGRGTVSGNSYRSDIAFSTVKVE